MLRSADTGTTKGPGAWPGQDDRHSACTGNRLKGGGASRAAGAGSEAVLHHALYAHGIAVAAICNFAGVVAHFHAVGDVADRRPDIVQVHGLEGLVGAFGSGHVGVAGIIQIGGSDTVAQGHIAGARGHGDAGGAAGGLDGLQGAGGRVDVGRGARVALQVAADAVAVGHAAADGDAFGDLGIGLQGQAPAGGGVAAHTYIVVADLAQQGGGGVVEVAGAALVAGGQVGQARLVGICSCWGAVKLIGNFSTKAIRVFQGHGEAVD